MRSGLDKLVSTKAESISNAAKVNFSFLSTAQHFPLVISPALSGLILTEWMKENSELFHKKLQVHGAILLRGFGINTVDKFQDFINVTGATPLEYTLRSSPRFEVAKNVYHSTTYPEDQHINMHSENSYSPQFPHKIVFCCIQPADQQGETPIADNRQVVKNLSPATKQKFLQKGVLYKRKISKGVGLPWQEVFQTNNKNEVEKECAANGMRYHWEDSDSLVLLWDSLAIHEHPATGEQVWFNHAFFFNKYALSEEVLGSFHSDAELPFNTFYGDGTEITREEIAEIKAAYEKASVVFPWQKGDVLFLDNMLMAHGRRPFKGDRKIVVSMF